MTAAVIDLLDPLQARYAEVSADRAALSKLARSGAQAAQSIAAPRLARAKAAIGLLPP